MVRLECVLMASRYCPTVRLLFIFFCKNRTVYKELRRTMEKYSKKSLKAYKMLKVTVYFAYFAYFYLHILSLTQKETIDRCSISVRSKKLFYCCSYTEVENGKKTSKIMHFCKYSSVLEYDLVFQKDQVPFPTNSTISVSIKLFEVAITLNKTYIFNFVSFHFDLYLLFISRRSNALPRYTTCTRAEQQSHSKRTGLRCIHRRCPTWARKSIIWKMVSPLRLGWKWMRARVSNTFVF